MSPIEKLLCQNKFCEKFYLDSWHSESSSLSREGELVWLVWGRMRWERNERESENEKGREQQRGGNES